MSIKCKAGQYGCDYYRNGTFSHIKYEIHKAEFLLVVH